MVDWRGIWKMERGAQSFMEEKALVPIKFILGKNTYFFLKVPRKYFIEEYLVGNNSLHIFMVGTY